MNKSKLSKLMSTIYNCSYYNCVDIYEFEDGSLNGIVCPQNCSTYMDGGELVYTISRSHNFGKQYRLMDANGLANYEDLTKKEILEKLCK